MKSLGVFDVKTRLSENCESVARTEHAHREHLRRGKRRYVREDRSTHIAGGDLTGVLKSYPKASHLTLSRRRLTHSLI